MDLTISTVGSLAPHPTAYLFGYPVRLFAINSFTMIGGIGRESCVTEIQRTAPGESNARSTLFTHKDHARSQYEALEEEFNLASAMNALAAKLV